MGGSGKFKMTNPETGKAESYDANPSYLTRAVENLTLSAGHAENVNKARAEIAKNTSQGIQSGDERKQ